MAAAALVPLLLFLALQSAFSAREQRRATETAALAKSESIMLGADGEVKRHWAALTALATAGAIHRGDVPGFRARAEELRGLEGWVGAELVDQVTGRTLVSVGSGGSYPILDPTLGRPGDTPRLAGFVRGPDCPCLLLDRRAASPAGTDWTVRLIIDTRAFTALLPLSTSQYKVSALVSRDGRFIARSLDPETRFATPGSKYVRAAIASTAMHGIYRGVTLEGFENYTAFTRSPFSGLSAHVALGSATIDTKAQQFLTSIGLAALLSLLLAAVLIWFALRQVAQGRRITEHMQQAQKLEALGQLTGGIAHDFNNLLTPIVGALDFIGKNPTLDARGKRLAAGALSSAERAGKLTAQLLAFSRRQKLLIEPINIAGMLDEMSGLFHQSVGDSYRFEVLQDDDGLCALGDHNQLELALLNLTLNARDASPPGGLIRIEVSADGDPGAGTIHIAVRDEGSGMDEDTRRRAFEPFFTTKPQGSGTGLGLAQVFGMAAQSGGKVSIDSAPGRGTTVALSLRRCRGAERRAARAASDAGAAAAPLRLLVVDDDAEVRSAIARPLEEAGHIVDAVSDGPTALAAIGQRAFDLVLVDFAMPGMDGAEIIRRAGDIRAGVRFLIVTGYSDSDAIALAAPDTPILKKPFDSDSLVALVGELTRS
ncbi:MAG: ATP-binding protein [Sphingomicrobium sp.]